MTSEALMRGNMGGLRDATRKLGLRSPRCFIKHVGNKISQCFRWDTAQSTSKILQLHDLNIAEGGGTLWGRESLPKLLQNQNVQPQALPFVIKAR